MTEHISGDGGSGDPGARGGSQPPRPTSVSAPGVPDSHQRALAKALHPAAGRRPWGRVTGGNRESGSAALPRPMVSSRAVAVLWDLQDCSDHLRSAPVGLLSYRGARGPVSVTVACVADADDLLLILPAEAAEAGSLGRPVSLLVKGTEAAGSWVVHVEGSIERVLVTATSDDAAESEPTRTHRLPLEVPDLGGFLVAALTPSQLRGYQHRLPPASGGEPR